jgi:hypothetical protein
VFVAFLFGLVAMTRFALAERTPAFLALTVTGVAAVTLTLAVNLGRGYPIASLLAAGTIAALLHRLWVRAGRPAGAPEAERLAEEAMSFEAQAGPPTDNV